jgi:hypothetical protein
MTSDLDIERVLDHWFTEQPTQVADRVFDGVADRIARQPQQPAWRVLERDLHVNTHLKPLLAIAAIVVVAVAGFAILRPSGGGVGGPLAPLSSPTAPPTPTPSPSSVASASPSIDPFSSAEFPDWYPRPSDGSGILPAGSQTTQAFLAGSTLTVPEGWVNDSDNDQVYTLFPNTSANEDEYDLAGQLAQDVLLVKTVANNMFTICEATGLFQGATAADVIDWAVTNEAFSTTEPVGVTIGGLSGQQVDIQLDPAWTGSCPLQENDPPTRDYSDARARIIMLDVPGRGPIGIHLGSKYSSGFEAFLADAMPIIESFEFDLEP